MICSPSRMFDEADHTVRVISSHHNRMDRVKELLYLTTSKSDHLEGADHVVILLLFRTKTIVGWSCWSGHVCVAHHLGALSYGRKWFRLLSSNVWRQSKR